MDSNKIDSIKMDLDVFLVNYAVQSTFLVESFINKDHIKKISHDEIGPYLAQKITDIPNWEKTYISLINIHDLLEIVKLDSKRSWNYFINSILYNLNDFYEELQTIEPVNYIKILMCSYQSIFFHSKNKLDENIHKGKRDMNSDYRIQDCNNSIFNVFINIKDGITTFSINKIYKIYRAKDESENIIKVVYNSIDIDLTNNEYKTDFIVFPNISIVNNYLPNLDKSKVQINSNFNRNLLEPEEGQIRAWSYFFINRSIPDNSNPKNVNTCIKKIKEMDESKELEIKYLLSQQETSNTLISIIKIKYPFSSKIIDYKKKIFYISTKKIFFQSYYIYEVSLERNVLFHIHVYQLLNITDNVLERYIVYKVLDRFININIKELIKLKFEHKDDRNKDTILDNIIKICINQSNTNTNILPKLNEILRKISIGRNVKPQENSITKFLNNITQTLPTLNKNKSFPSKQSDFLLISFNEAAQSYNYSDCLPMIIKVLTEKPKIIVVCTQDSASKRYELFRATHYQHVFGEILKNLEYKCIEKVDGSSTKKNMETPSIFGKIFKSLKGVVRTATVSLAQYNKGIRTRIYFLSEFRRQLYNQNASLTNASLTNASLSNSKQLLLGTFTELSLYDGAILTKLNFKVSEKDYKIAVVNCNLFYKHQAQTGLEKRIEEFNRIVDEFKLSELNIEYDIFFCGDTNFRLFTHNITNNSAVVRSRKIVKSYIDNKKSLNKSNEFYGVLQNKIEKSTEQSKEQIFYQKLLDSMNLLGTHLTSKYMVSKTNYSYLYHIKLYRLLNTTKINQTNLNTLINSVFNITPKKNSNIRVPSQTDRILFSLKNDTSISINPNDFNIHLFLDKSDHKMISLTFNFQSINNNRHIPVNLTF